MWNALYERIFQPAESIYDKNDGIAPAKWCDTIVLIAELAWQGAGLPDN